MFVGITRAREELQISRAVYRDFRGQRRMTVPSGFLMELPRGEMLVQEAESARRIVEPLPEEEQTYVRETDPAHTDASPACAPAGVSLRGPSTRHRAAPGLPQLTTAAELAGGDAAPVSPDLFCQGMVVRHPNYGLGRIVALSGSGSKRQATVDFARDRLKFVLAMSPLRPVRGAGP